MRGGFLDLGKAFYFLDCAPCHLIRQTKGLTAVVAFTCSISPSVSEEPQAAEERRWPSAQLPKSHPHIAYLGALSTPYVSNVTDAAPARAALNTHTTTADTVKAQRSFAPDDPMCSRPPRWASPSQASRFRSVSGL